jgi:hypothetical protein
MLDYLGCNHPSSHRCDPLASSNYFIENTRFSNKIIQVFFQCGKPAYRERHVHIIDTLMSLVADSCTTTTEPTTTTVTTTTTSITTSTTYWHDYSFTTTSVTDTTTTTTTMTTTTTETFSSTTFPEWKFAEQKLIMSMEMGMGQRWEGLESTTKPTTEYRTTSGNGRLDRLFSYLKYCN